MRQNQFRLNFVFLIQLIFTIVLLFDFGDWRGDALSDSDLTKSIAQIVDAIKQLTAAQQSNPNIVFQVNSNNGNNGSINSVQQNREGQQGQQNQSALTPTWDEMPKSLLSRAATCASNTDCQKRATANCAATCHCDSLCAGSPVCAHDCKWICYEECSALYLVIERAQQLQKDGPTVSSSCVADCKKCDCQKPKGESCVAFCDCQVGCAGNSVCLKQCLSNCKEKCSDERFPVSGRK